ncbi:Putative F0F1-ATPase subunit Ca2+/Mg2+ transporter [Janibacter indicus]|uniref:Putative F0F1-ATPase subunit Ca2+/Mg2+ transporter n=1 Tax=Janibacter indicus TaxID=857417 RepID=A0A1W1Y5E9_9MICO|nr:Putative F0F1-ATPase subunit Ca2+/Mg2+ transporter [Janibacter indicus]
MSAIARRRKGETPRFVTKALPSAEESAASAERYRTDPTRPHPAAASDAMAATVLAHLITGPILYGAIGWLLDRWLGTSFLVIIGIVGGMALSLYVIWLRYGTSQAPTDDAPSAGKKTAAQPHNEENQ